MRKEANTTYIHIYDHMYIPGEGSVLHASYGTNSISILCDIKFDFIKI